MAVPLLDVSFLSPFKASALFFAAASCQAGMVAALPLPNLLLPNDAAGATEAGAVAGTPAMISAGVDVVLKLVVGEFAAGASVDVEFWTG